MTRANEGNKNGTVAELFIYTETETTISLCLLNFDFYYIPIVLGILNIPWRKVLGFTNGKIILSKKKHYLPILIGRYDII